MALYNDSDSDSDNEFFTNNAQKRLTRNTNFALRPKMYEEEEEKAELVYTKDIKKFNPYNLMFDDNESVGSAFSIPKRVRQSTDADSVDSDNDFEPYMRGRKLVIATNDDIENFLDGNPVGQKQDNDGELDEYGSASDMEEGGGSVSGSEEEVLVKKEEKEEEPLPPQGRKFLVKKKVKKVDRERKELSKEQVREILAKVRSAKKSKSSKPNVAPAKAIVAPAIALKSAEKIIQEATGEGKPLPEAIKIAKKFLVEKKEEAEEAKAEESEGEELGLADAMGALSLSSEIKQKEQDLKILQAKPIPEDPNEAQALKKSITILKRLIKRIKNQATAPPALFKSANIEEREVGKGKGSMKIFYKGVEVTPTKMTINTMETIKEEILASVPSKARTRALGKMVRAISGRKKRDEATGRPDEIALPKSPKVAKAPKSPKTPSKGKANSGGGGGARKSKKE